MPADLACGLLVGEWKCAIGARGTSAGPYKAADAAHLLQQDQQTGVAIFPLGHKIGVVRRGLGGDFLAAIRAGKNAKLEAFAVDGVRFDPFEMRGAAALATRPFNGLDYFVHGCLTSSPDNVRLHESSNAIQQQNAVPVKIVCLLAVSVADLMID
jgi:hypothetical protein